jgi:hypothetical protein
LICADFERSVDSGHSQQNPAQTLGNLQSRMVAIVMGINPPDPFAAHPDLGENWRKALLSA